jgi:TolA-binding protein
MAQIGERPDGPYAGPARFLAAESLLRQDKVEEALPLYVAVAEKKVANYCDRALYQAGRCAARLEKWPESQQHYEALVGQFADFEQIDEARYGLALALQKQNKLAEAKPVYQQVAAANKATETAAKARFMLGEIAFAEQDYDGAIEQFLIVASGFPYGEWKAKARLEAGRCFIEQGKKQQALASLKIVVDQHADSPEAESAARLIEELQK